MVNNTSMVCPDRLSICEHQSNHSPCRQQDNPHNHQFLHRSNSQNCLYHHQPIYHQEREPGMRHHIFKVLWKSNFSSPVEKRLLSGGACVLIVGSNPSIMTFDLATAYPHSTFIGLEIFPPHVSSPPLSPSSPSIEPPNATILRTHTSTSPQIPFPKECFDFVYFHSLMVPIVIPRDHREVARESQRNGFLREFEGLFRGKDQFKFKEEMRMVKDMIRVLKPNGWIEFMGIESMCDCKFGSVTKKMVDSYLEYMGSANAVTLNPKSLRSLLTSNSKLCDVTKESKNTLLGVCGGRIGELLTDTLLHPINSNKSSLSTFMKIPLQEFNEMYGAMNKEITECRSYCQSYRIYSRKS